MKYEHRLQPEKLRRLKKLIGLDIGLLAIFFSAMLLTPHIAGDNQAVSANPTAKKEAVKESPSNEEKIPTIKATVKADSLVDTTYNYACGQSYEKIEAPDDSIIGKTKEQIENENENCVVSSITDEMVVMNVFYNSSCDEHYIIKLEGNKLRAYEKDNKDIIVKEIIIERSSVYSEDIPILENGIEASTREEMLEYLEDFSS